MAVSLLLALAVFLKWALLLLTLPLLVELLLLTLGSMLPAHREEAQASKPTALPASGSTAAAFKEFQYDDLNTNALKPKRLMVIVPSQMKSSASLAVLQAWPLRRGAQTMCL